MKLKTNKSAVAAPVFNLVNEPLAHIVDHPDVAESYRPLDKGWAVQLKESIKADGLDTPLIVWDGGGDVGSAEIEINGKTETIENPSFLIAGRHRREALRLLAKEDPAGFGKRFPEGKIPCRKVGGSLQTALVAMLRENCARQDPTVEELLPTMVRLRDDFGMNGKTIAQHIGKSTAFVSQVFGIETNLGEEGIKAVIKGNVSAKHAMKAAAEVGKAKKAGKPVNVPAAIKTAQSKTATETAENRQREKKRPSLAKLWSLFALLPNLPIGKKFTVLSDIVKYSLKLTNKLPAELKEAVKIAKAAKEAKEAKEAKGAKASK